MELVDENEGLKIRVYKKGELIALLLRDTPGIMPLCFDEGDKIKIVRIFAIIIATRTLASKELDATKEKTVYQKYNKNREKFEIYLNDMHYL